MNLGLSSLRDAYLRHHVTPAEVMAEIDARAEACASDCIFIHRLDAAARAPYLARLAEHAPEALPLYGIPFAIKDNIDLAGVPTTAACPAFSRVPARSAAVVDKLIDAGAIPIGKTNLDQFATGLVGTRSPYGATRNAFNPAYISGGSSGGSAVACARGLASFALGTDTAGSGRVPAALNALVGLKPTRGLLSLRGVVPACQSLDCVSIFAHSVADAAAVFGHVADFDAEDPFARAGELFAGPQGAFRFGVPDALEFFGDAAAPGLFADAVARMIAIGGIPVHVDFAPFIEAARLLYEGPWVAERYVAIRALFDTRPEALHPVTRAIIAGGVERSAADVYTAMRRLAEIRRVTDSILATVDCVLTPTIGRAYTLAEVTAEPVQLNSNLGHYTNFMNLLDYAAVAVPMGRTPDGVPLGVTLFAPAFRDLRLLETAARYLGEPWEAPAALHAEHLTRVVVCGAHMRGLPLNAELTARGGRFLRALRTARAYRLYALPGGPPARPGLLCEEPGAAIEVEEWGMPPRAFGDFVARVPAPLSIGRVMLEDGTSSAGFLCEVRATRGARDITAYAGWRNFLAAEAGR
ncbi:MAG: allophanate hydrolase [Gammaproteobacteria bacterium]